MLDLVALLLVVFVNAALALLVLSRNTKNIVNRLYSLLALAVIAWSSFNYFSNHVKTYQVQLIINRLAFTSGFVLLIVVWFFSLYFPKRLQNNRKQKKLVLLCAPIILVLTMTNLVIEKVTYRPERDLTEIIPGSLYAIYIAGVIFLAVFLVGNLYTARKTSKTFTMRQQVVFVGAGILLTFLWILLSSAVLPAITNNWGISKLGTLGSLSLVGLTAYAVVKHKLFDIKLIVARSLAYIFTLSSLVVTLSVFGYLLTVRIFAASENQTLRFIVTTALLIVASLTFEPIKQFFNRITNKIFYRDAYDAQALFDEFNKALVSEIRLEKLLKKVSTVIQTYLKAEYVVVDVQKTTDAKRYVGGTVNKKYDEEDLQKLIAVSPSLPFVVIAIDYLDEEYADLKTLFNKNEVAMVVRLVNASSNGDPDVGYIILGQKKSGNIYNKQDIAIMEILANELLLAIQNALQFEEIEQFNITLQQRVDDATRKLRQTNEKLKQLDENKDEFISMASHQLRTPLTAVKGYLSMVLEGDSGKITNSQQKLLDQAFVSSQRMVYLIADLLNVSRLKTGKFIIEAVPTNLAEIVQGEMEQLTETATARNLELTYDMPDDFPMLMLDEIKTRQVVMNFIDNAIYYTLSGGHIRVVVEDKGKTVEFRVEDDGLGVPKSEQHHLFTKFYRAGNAKKARPDGTGLGLFMAKKVVVAQGGAIIFHSVEGKGSTFGFSFAKSKLQPRSRV